MSSTSRNDNAIVIDVTSQLSGIILSIPKRGWLPSAPQSLAPMIGWLRGRDADTTTELEGLDELMASVQQQFDKANNEELNRILEKLSVFSPGNDDDDEEEEHTNLICLAFRRVCLNSVIILFTPTILFRCHLTHIHHILRCFIQHILIRFSF